MFCPGSEKHEPQIPNFEGIFAARHSPIWSRRRAKRTPYLVQPGEKNGICGKKMQEEPPPPSSRTNQVSLTARKGHFGKNCKNTRWNGLPCKTGFCVIRGNVHELCASCTQFFNNSLRQFRKYMLALWEVMLYYISIMKFQ